MEENIGCTPSGTEIEVPHSYYYRITPDGVEHYDGKKWVELSTRIYEDEKQILWAWE
jgi:hypothetical protein